MKVVVLPVVVIDRAQYGQEMVICRAADELLGQTGPDLYNGALTKRDK